MTPETEAVALAAKLRLAADDMDGLEAIHDALVAARDVRDAELRHVRAIECVAECPGCRSRWPLPTPEAP